MTIPIVMIPLPGDSPLSVDKYIPLRNLSECISTTNDNIISVIDVIRDDDDNEDGTTSDNGEGNLYGASSPAVQDDEDSTRDQDDSSTHDEG